MITARTPTFFDCADLMANLRAHDRAEVEAIGGRTATDLWDACENAREARAVFDDGRLVCIYGVTPLLTARVGVVWLLGTPLLDRRMISLCKHARDVIDRWQRGFSVLTNHTDQRNRRVLIWLRWLGFKLVHTIDVNGHPFIQFERTSPCVGR